MDQIANRGTFCTVPRFTKIPFLVHGFGTKYIKEEDLVARWEIKKLYPVFLDQIHSDVIHLVDTLPRHRLRGDALLSRQAGMLLVVRTADCLPVFIVDTAIKAIAAVHCGWKGTSQGLIKKVVRKMMFSIGSEISSLWVGLGPCIECDCYQVGEDVREAFRDDKHRTRLFQPHARLPGKYFFDLKEANRRQLVDYGVESENIFSLDECTYCHDDLISFRQEREKAGRMLNFIGMLEEKI